MAAYGLWVLTSSFTAYFAMLDLGYGGALVRFVAQYRARRDAQALNEILSTFSVVYTAIGAVTYALVLVIAFNLDLLTRLTPEQAATSRTLLLIIGANVALRFVAGVYGGVIVGFQRYHLNNLTSIATSVAVAIANVVVLLEGHGIVALVAVTTAVRVLALLVYRLNAYRVFPALAMRWSLFRRERLQEVSGFSVFMMMLDAAYKVNYSTDVLVIGAWLGAPAVALWAPAQRLSELTLRLSNQLSEALFPIVVDCDASQRAERLRTVLIHGTRLSLATVLPSGRRAGAPGAPAADRLDWSLVHDDVHDCADPGLRRHRARRFLHGIGRPQGRGHASAAHHAGRAHGGRQPRAEHRPGRCPRARRRGARDGRAGRTHCHLWPHPFRVPAGADLSCRALPEGPVAGAVAGGSRRLDSRRNPNALSRHLAGRGSAARHQQRHLLRAVPFGGRERGPPRVPGSTRMCY